MTQVAARAPASTANLGPGYDVFGLAVDAFHDTVSIRESGDGRITISADGGVPLDPAKNTAGMAVQAMRDELGIESGIHMTITKGVPAGFGMGSSAASAAAAAVAFDAFCGLNLDRKTLVRYAGYGEKASAGSVHYDNVAASVCGGFVVVRPDPLMVTTVRPPPELAVCIAVPRTDVPEKKTQVSRGVVPSTVPLGKATANLANASSMVAGFLKGDVRLIGDSMVDVIVEPARKHMIPGFDEIKRLASEAGAVGVTISGAGPSVVAFADGTGAIDSIQDAMRRGFESGGVGCRTIPCRPAQGARLVDDGHRG